ncbi:MAG: methyltransferase family protein [Chloroflexota bacterium]
MEPDVWNAWLFFVFYWLSMPLLMLRCPSILGRLSAGPSAPKERVLRIAQWVLFLVAAVYSVFVPLQVGTTWFAVGLPIALVGAAGFGLTVLSLPGWEAASGPLRTGPYRFSRHPMYVTSIVMFLGVAIACRSLPLFIYVVLMATLQVIAARQEECQCLVTYGDDYAQYMRKTPRWLGPPRG